MYIVHDVQFKMGKQLINGNVNVFIKPILNYKLVYNDFVF